MNKLLPRIAIAVVAAATCVAASAQTDQERRDRNREEALANWRAMHPASAQPGEANGQVVPAERRTMRERAHRGAEKTRGAAHRVAEKSRHIGHRTAEKSREIGHRTAEKARDITERTDAKFDKHNKPIRDPQGGGSSN